ncbi:unnamed protein product, partial [Rotaria sp. Silwood2]
IAMSMGKNIFARTLQYFVIGTPEEMTRAQIDEAVEKFADAAEIMAKANFARVEIHTSHGYLGVWGVCVCLLFPPTPKPSREAYFVEFAAKIHHTTRIPLIVTGGFRTRE